jgi:UDP-N-acetylglucosamine--N-acetylmuramyl-(pentapeptide) pyrophosphoryl-undecaprenol N-acetylglucosamine transferase
VLELLPQLLAKYEVIHQCGIADYENIKTSSPRSTSVPRRLPPVSVFKQSLANAYAACDLVVSRAGANSVAEIMLMGKPASSSR